MWRGVIYENIQGPDRSVKAHKKAKGRKGLRSKLDREEPFGLF